MRPILIAVHLILLVFTSTSMAIDKDLSLVIIGYAKDGAGNYVGHLKYETLQSDWSAIGKEDITARLESRFGTVKTSNAVVKPGECYVLYTGNDGGIKKIYRATAKTEEKFLEAKQRIRAQAAEQSKANIKYLEDGCNINISIERVPMDGEQSFDAFAESFRELTLEQGRFRCKSNGKTKSEFNVRRIRPGVYYFVSSSSEAGPSNGYKIPLDVRNALMPDKPTYYIKNARNQYHSAIKKMCESHVTPKKGMDDAAYDFISNWLFKMYTDCKKEQRPEEECRKIRDRRDSVEGIRG